MFPKLAMGTIGFGGIHWLMEELCSSIIFYKIQSEAPGGPISPEIVKELLYPKEENYAG